MPRIISKLDTSRPAVREAKQDFLWIIAVLGIAFGVGALTTSMLGTHDNEKEIQTLNNNIHKINANIKITNERITILSENVTNAANNVKVILDQIVTMQEPTFTIPFFGILISS